MADDPQPLWPHFRSRGFFIGRDELLTPGSWKRQARSYFAALLDYERLEPTNDLLRAHRLQRGWGLGEAAFLFAGIEDTDPLPNKLRAARLRTGLSQEDVASIIDKPRHLLARYERGERNPDLVTAMSLSVLYDLPLNKLFPQRIGAVNAFLKKRERMLGEWRRTCRRSPTSSAR